MLQYHYTYFDEGNHGYISPPGFGYCYAMAFDLGPIVGKIGEKVEHEVYRYCGYDDYEAISTGVHYKKDELDDLPSRTWIEQYVKDTFPGLEPTEAPVKGVYPLFEQYAGATKGVQPALLTMGDADHVIVRIPKIQKEWDSLFIQFPKLFNRLLSGERR